MRKLKSKGGFTLVELMIVVVILGILVAVAVPIFTAVTANARKKTCHNNIDMIERAVTQYLVDTGADTVQGVFKTAYSGPITVANQTEAEAKLTDEFLNGFEGHHFPFCPDEDSVYTIAIKDNSDERALEVTCSEHGGRND